MTSGILSVKVTPLSAAGGARKAIGGFLRYIQHRDHHFDTEQVRDVDGLVRYVAFRDAASPEGRLFDANRTVGREERLDLVQHVALSLDGVEPRWIQGRDGKLRDQSIAVYSFVLSPANARGLDLRQLTRETMGELERKLGGSRAMPPWIGAEHRNTEHPHVHIVMAARREVQQGRYRELHLTRDRLRAMKETMWTEIERQRLDRSRTHEEQGNALARYAQRNPRPHESPPREPPSRRSYTEIDPIAITNRRLANTGVRRRTPPARRGGRARASVRESPVRGLASSVSHALGAYGARQIREAEREAWKRRYERDEDRDMEVSR